MSYDGIYRLERKSNMVRVNVYALALLLLLLVSGWLRAFTLGERLDASAGRLGAIERRLALQERKGYTIKLVLPQTFPFVWAKTKTQEQGLPGFAEVVPIGKMEGREDEP